MSSLVGDSRGQWSAWSHVLLLTMVSHEETLSMSQEEEDEFGWG